MTRLTCSVQVRAHGNQEIVTIEKTTETFKPDSSSRVLLLKPSRRPTGRRPLNRDRKQSCTSSVSAKRGTFRLVHERRKHDKGSHLDEPCDVALPGRSPTEGRLDKPAAGGGEDFGFCVGMDDKRRPFRPMVRSPSVNVPLFVLQIGFRNVHKSTADRNLTQSGDIRYTNYKYNIKENDMKRFDTYKEKASFCSGTKRGGGFLRFVIVKSGPR